MRQRGLGAAGPVVVHQRLRVGELLKRGHHTILGHDRMNDCELFIRSQQSLQIRNIKRRHIGHDFALHLAAQPLKPLHQPSLHFQW